MVSASGRDILLGAGGGTSVVLKTVQPAGKSAMAAGDWWRGVRVDDPHIELPSSGEAAS